MGASILMACDFCGLGVTGKSPLIWRARYWICHSLSYPRTTVLSKTASPTSIQNLPRSAETNKKSGAWLDTDIAICNTYNYWISIIRRASMKCNFLRRVEKFLDRRTLLTSNIMRIQDFEGLEVEGCERACPLLPR